MLLRSRKFQLVLVDAAFGLGALFVGYFLADSIELQVLIIAAFAVVQPVFISAIKAVADEDVAAYASGSHPNS